MTETPLSRRLRRASSSRRGDPILLLAAAEIEKLSALTVADPNDAALIGILQSSLEVRHMADFSDALSRLGRRDVRRLLDALHAPPEDDHLHRDSGGTKLTIDDQVLCNEDCTATFAGKTGTIATLGIDTNEEIVMVRLDGETFGRPFHPSKLTRVPE